MALRMCEVDFQCVYSASNRNECRNISWG